MPNVIDSLVVIVAARALDARLGWRDIVSEALRFVVGVMPLRTAVVDDVARAVVERAAFVLRIFVDVSRDTDFFVSRAVVAREIVVLFLLTDCEEEVLRTTVFSLRTAALAKPTLNINASVNARCVLIPFIYLYIIYQKCPLWANIYLLKC